MKIIPPVGSWVLITELGAIGQVISVVADFLWAAEGEGRRAPLIIVSSSALDTGMESYSLGELELIGWGDLV